MFFKIVHKLLQEAWRDPSPAAGGLHTPVPHRYFSLVFSSSPRHVVQPPAVTLLLRPSHLLITFFCLFSVLSETLQKVFICFTMRPLNLVEPTVFRSYISSKWFIFFNCIHLFFSVFCIFFNLYFFYLIFIYLFIYFFFFKLHNHKPTKTKVVHLQARQGGH